LWLLLGGRDGRERYVALHGGSSFDLCRITAHAGSGSGRGGGTAVFKFYELRDNLGEHAAAGPVGSKKHSDHSVVGRDRPSA